MESQIKNVAIGECQFDPVVSASSGVETCVAVVVVLHGGGVVMAHVDAAEIWAEVASVEIAAQVFVESCVKRLMKKRPDVAIDGVFLIGGRDTPSYHQFGQVIDRARTSPRWIPRSKKVTTERLHDFLTKIKVSLLTFNIRRQRSAKRLAQGEEDDDEGHASDFSDDQVTDATVIYNGTTSPARIIVVQRSGEDGTMNGSAPPILPFVIYQINAESGKIFAITYPPLFASPVLSALRAAIRRNGIDHSSGFHRFFDLPEDDPQKILLLRVK